MAKRTALICVLRTTPFSATGGSTPLHAPANVRPIAQIGPLSGRPTGTVPSRRPVAAAQVKIAKVAQLEPSAEAHGVIR